MPNPIKTPPKFDVIVAGGGPAGTGAALAAARQGAKTLLIERIGHLGGVHTGAGVVTFCESWGGATLDELTARVSAFGGVKWHYNPARQVGPGRPDIDTELAKAVALQMLLEAGVTVLFLTFCRRLIVENGKAVGVEIVNKSGTQIIHAHTVIDATADADLAADAGVPFVTGDPQDGRLQHCNFRSWFSDIDPVAYNANKPTPEQLWTWVQEARASGMITVPDNVFQPEHAYFPLNRKYGSIQFSAWEIEKVNPLDEFELSKTLAQCNVAALGLLAFGRKYLPGHEKCTLRKLPSFMGIRESRRIQGAYTLTSDDVIAGRKFDDGIACCWFYMDLHDSPPGDVFPHSTEHVWASRPARGDWFEVPFRCLIPPNIKNFLVTGRAISADREAMGASRVMAVCMATGYAAGTASAWAIKENTTPDLIDGKRLKAHVMQGFKPPSKEVGTPR
jgi:hypothetical protein